MTRFAPEEIFSTLNGEAVAYVVIGGIAGVLHGSPLRTGDADICPASDGENLERLARALRSLEAEIRTDRDLVPMVYDARLLASADTWNLSTPCGDVDIAFTPAGTTGYDDLIRAAVTYELEGGVEIKVASLDDVIRSKRAAGRQKDAEALPVLEALRDRTSRG